MVVEAKKKPETNRAIKKKVFCSTPKKEKKNESLIREFYKRSLASRVTRILRLYFYDKTERVRLVAGRWRVHQRDKFEKIPATVREAYLPSSSLHRLDRVLVRGIRTCNRSVNYELPTIIRWTLVLFRT